MKNLIRLAALALLCALAPLSFAENQAFAREKSYSVGGALDLVGTVGYLINPVAGTITISRTRH